jgi:hypothetical protein
MYRSIIIAFPTNTTLTLRPAWILSGELSKVITRPVVSLGRHSPSPSRTPHSLRYFSSSVSTMGQDDPKTVRPPHKRVRSTDEHVDPENTAQPLSQSNNMKDGEAPEWLTKPPFQYNQSWDGWDRKWRCSCWCGKSESLPSICLGTAKTRKRD